MFESGRDTRRSRLVAAFDGPIGILLNGMTMMNLSYTSQNIIKAMILLAALVLDSIVSPRDAASSPVSMK